ncbi:MAG: flagellin lysine-N-methylase [bacterium]
MAPVFFPDIVARVQCQCCGDCCRLGAIPLDENSLARLKARLEGNPLIPYPPFTTLEDERGKEVQVLNRVEGHCVFLDQNNLCLIHKGLGPEAKPRICQEFPRGAVFTPKGVFLTVSFACPAVLNYLKDKAPLRMGKTEEPNFSLPKDTSLSLMESFSFSWEEYLRLESSLLDILIRPEYSFEERLVMGDFLLQEIVKERLGGSLLEAYLVRQREEGYKNLFTRIRDIPPSIYIQFSFLETFLKTRLEFSHPPWSLFYSRDLNEGISFLLKNLSGLSGETIYYQAYSNLYQPSLPALTPILERYFQIKLLGKHLTILPEVVRSYLFLVIYYVFIRFYSLTLALKTNRPVDEALILKSINFLERYFVHSRQVRGFWTGLKDKFLDSPSLAATLIKSLSQNLPRVTRHPVS